MPRLCVLSVSLAALTACATATPSPHACVDASRQVRHFFIENDRTVVVEYSPSSRYRVVLADACDGLQNAQDVGFSNGFPRMLDDHRFDGPVWAETIHGSGRVCGFAGDSLLLLDDFSPTRMPPLRCRIAHIQRL